MNSEHGSGQAGPGNNRGVGNGIAHSRGGGPRRSHNDDPPVMAGREPEHGRCRDTTTITITTTTTTTTATTGLSTGNRTHGGWQLATG
jgi:hypothetical protein